MLSNVRNVLAQPAAVNLVVIHKFLESTIEIANSALGRQWLCELPREVVQLACTIMHNLADEVQIQLLCCKLIASLVIDKEPSQVWLIDQPYNVFLPLLSIFEVHQETPDVLAEACFALQALAKGNANNIKVLVDTHLVHQVVVNAMRSHPEHNRLLIQGAAVLRRVSWTNDIAKAKLIKPPCNAHEFVIDTMKQHLNDTEFLDHACALLGNLAALNPDAVASLSNAGARPAVLSALTMHPDDPIVAEMGFYALSRLSSFVPHLPPTEQRMEQQVGSTIVEGMRRHASLSNVVQACLSSLLLSDYTPDGLTGLIRPPHELHKIVLDVMRIHHSDVRVQIFGASAFASMARSIEGAVLLVNEPICAHEAVLKALTLDVKHENLQISTLVALANLCQTEELQHDIVEKYQVHLNIAASMKSHQTSILVQQWGCATLMRLAETHSTRALLVAGNLHVQILNAMRLFPRVPDVQKYGCSALANLANDVTVARILMSKPFNAHKCILSGMRIHFSHVSIQHKSVLALEAFSLDPQNKKILLSHSVNACDRLIAALRAQIFHESLNMHACNALITLISGNDALLKRLVQPPYKLQEILFGILIRELAAVEVLTSATSLLYELSACNDNCPKLYTCAFTVILNVRSNLEQDVLISKSLLFLRNVIHHPKNRLGILKTLIIDMVRLVDHFYQEQHPEIPLLAAQLIADVLALAAEQEAMDTNAAAAAAATEQNEFKRRRIQ